MSGLAHLVVFSTGEYEDVIETVLGVFLDATDAELFANASSAELVSLGWDRATMKDVIRSAGVASLVAVTYERREWRGLNVDYTGADIEVRTAPLNPARPGVTP